MDRKLGILFYQRGFKILQRIVLKQYVYAKIQRNAIFVQECALVVGHWFVKMFKDIGQRSGGSDVADILVDHVGFVQL